MSQWFIKKATSLKIISDRGAYDLIMSIGVSEPKPIRIVQHISTHEYALVPLVIIVYLSVCHNTCYMTDHLAITAPTA